MTNQHINAFKKELAEILVTSIEELEQSNLANFATWDSLAIVSTMAMMAEYFGVNVSGEEVEQCQTLQDLLMLGKVSLEAA